jgi:prepilin-type N-terminal cleavage/methylation domain-containing protein
MMNNNMLRILTARRGMTMVELMVTTVVFGMVLAVLNSIFFSSNRMYAKTNQRVNIQMNSRMGMSIMTKEIRHAGCDPTGMGVDGIVRATADTIRVRGDLDGDGAISTVEPSEDVIYFYDSVNLTLSRDPGTGAEVIVPNVTNASFTYLDGTNNPLGPLPLDANLANRVRTVAVTITSTSADAGDMTLTTSIALRN